jgi:hypothetical protein
MRVDWRLEFRRQYSTANVAIACGAPDGRAGDPHRVKLGFDQGETVEGFVTDVSPGGLGLLIRRKSIVTSSELLKLEFLDGAEAGSEARAQLRNLRHEAEHPGWVRIGILRTTAEMFEPIEGEYWTAIMDGRVRPERPSQLRATLALQSRSSCDSRTGRAKRSSVWSTLGGILAAQQPLLCRTVGGKPRGCYFHWPERSLRPYARHVNRFAL